MGKWQACRPKALRSGSELQFMLTSALEPLKALALADLRCFRSPTQFLKDAICSLWQVFQDGLCMQGDATEVGVTKAILLVTKGRLGPAFDSNVKSKLKASYVIDAKTYLKAIAALATELAGFEDREQKSIEDLAAMAGRPAGVGRVIDMILGPRPTRQ